MSQLVDDILTLLTDLEEGDPLDFGDVPLDEQDARRLIALSMAQLSEDLREKGISADSREVLALAVATRVMLDNLILNYRLLQQGGGPIPNAQQLINIIANRAPRA